jgi:hypothetical protein
MMSSTIIAQLVSIRDQLDEKQQQVCAAHVQLVIDKLSAQERAVWPEAKPNGSRTSEIAS